jgi:hypothetical protein
MGAMYLSYGLGIIATAPVWVPMVWLGRSLGEVVLAIGSLLMRITIPPMILFQADEVILAHRPILQRRDECSEVIAGQIRWQVEWNGEEKAHQESRSRMQRGRIQRRSAGNQRCGRPGIPHQHGGITFYA